MKIAQTNPWGKVQVPLWVSKFGSDVGGIQVLLNIILRTLVVIAGIYTVFNLILAGYAYIAAGGEPKRIQDATAKITQSLIGLVVAAGAFIIAAVVGQILYGDPGAILNIQYFTPQ